MHVLPLYLHSFHSFFYRYRAHRDLHSFPTRRSSDLDDLVGRRGDVVPARRGKVAHRGDHLEPPVLACFQHLRVYLLGGYDAPAGTVDAQHHGLDAGVVPEPAQFLDGLPGIRDHAFDADDRDSLAAEPASVQRKRGEQGNADDGEDQEAQQSQRGPDCPLPLHRVERYWPFSSSPLCCLFFRAARPRDWSTLPWLA